MSRYVVLDMEMCRIPRLFRGQPLPLKQEVIQIGAVLVDENMAVRDSFITYVKPEKGVIDKTINRLTGISQKDLTGAPDIRTAFYAMLDWMPEDAVIVSWSESDLAQLQNEFSVKGIEIPRFDRYSESWIDCQKTFSEKMHTEKVYRLSEALSITDIYYEDGAHDALVDAKNTAQLFIKMSTEKELKLSKYYSCVNTYFAEGSAGLLGNYAYA
ncbi:MAG: exonuclease domain-containing protein [Oscillospiraceae bacterium]|nr:exonuclease domain-containing protein [Oscillospiraceae bacterium]